MRAALDPNGTDAYWAGRFGLIPLERRAQDYCFSFPPFSLTLTSKTKTPRPPKDHSREGGAKSHPAPEEGA